MGADPNSYGFRPVRSAADAIERGFIILCGKKFGTMDLRG